MFRKYLVDIVHEAVSKYHRIWSNENYYKIKDDANARRLFFADIRIRCQRQEINELHNQIAQQKALVAELRAKTKPNQLNESEGE
jgi:hypothetical protein